jgi:hypothetical protein
VWFARASRFCATVQDIKANPAEKYVDFVSGAAASFFGVYAHDDCSYHPFLINQKEMNTKTSIQNKKLSKCQ